jgi:hypothetical protein
MFLNSLFTFFLLVLKLLFLTRVLTPCNSGETAESFSIIVILSISLPTLLMINLLYRISLDANVLTSCMTVRFLRNISFQVKY